MRWKQKVNSTWPGEEEVCGMVMAQVQLFQRLDQGKLILCPVSQFTGRSNASSLKIVNNINT